MNSLLLRSIQTYMRGTFGAAAWARTLRAARQPPEGFEPMLLYETEVIDLVLEAVAVELRRPVDSILEDVGTFLIADPGHQAFRRLLRFGGASFGDFLHSLDELPDRARMALPGLDLPQIALIEEAPDLYRLTMASPLRALFPIALGALRAMADDYGALVLIDLEPGLAGPNSATLKVHLLVASHGVGRGFALAQMGDGDDR